MSVRIPRAGRLFRLVTTAAAAALCALAASSGLFYLGYPGLSRAVYNQMTTATAAENRNLFFCLDYWMEYIQLLRRDEATGLYNFEGVDEAGFDDFARGRLLFHRGRFAEAVSAIERDIGERGETEPKLFWLAVSYMRLAEAENCLDKLTGAPPPGGHGAGHPHGDLHGLCSLPLTRFHDRAASARASAKLFEKLLDRYGPKDRLYQWLLNFNYMAVGGFPAEVPPRYRIESDFVSAFYGRGREEAARAHAGLSFAERAGELGVAAHNTGRGVAVEDFDRDGDLDIVTGGSFESAVYYSNDGGRRFLDRTAEVGLAAVTQPFVITAADYDNDGWVDLFFARPFGSYSLYRNRGDGTFADVTEAAGLLAGGAGELLSATWVVAWGDVDLDGDLDLFLAQWGLKIPLTSGLMALPRRDSCLFVNEGGRFRDRTEEFGLGRVVRDQYFIGAAFGDYDADGYPDLFLSSPLRDTSVLLRNQSGRGFAETDLVRRASGGFAASFVDVNHDGRLDLFWAGFADARTSTEQVVFGDNLDRYRSGRSTIFLQTPDGRFAERDDFFDMPASTMGSSFGDLNNDGCYDFYLGTGDPEPWFVLPNLMYLGRTDGTKCSERLANVSMLHGFGTVQKGHGIVFFDFDDDGDQDVYSSLGGMWPADRWPNQFFVNESDPVNSWTKIRLRGRRTNYYGVGATIRVTAETGAGPEVVRHYLMDQKTGFGSAPYLAHVGLMNAARIREVRVEWPASGCARDYPAELNRLNVLDEADCFR